MFNLLYQQLRAHLSQDTTTSEWKCARARRRKVPPVLRPQRLSAASGASENRDCFARFAKSNENTFCVRISLMVRFVRMDLFASATRSRHRNSDTAGARASCGGMTSWCGPHRPQPDKPALTRQAEPLGALRGL